MSQPQPASLSSQLARRVDERLAQVFNRAVADGHISIEETMAFGGYLLGAADAARVVGSYDLAHKLSTAGSELVGDWHRFTKLLPELHKTLVAITHPHLATGR